MNTRSRQTTDTGYGSTAAAAYPVDRARGGVSPWSILSGMLVAFGAFVVVSAIVGAILAAIGSAEGGIQANEIEEAGLGVGIGLIISQFLAYMWGGYTAGRMARGSGWVNGILVAVTSIILVAILGGILAALVGNATNGNPTDVNLQSLPLPLGNLGDIATGTGIGLLIAMLGGGALGGHLGQRWHNKLENSEAGTGY